MLSITGNPVLIVVDIQGGSTSSLPTPGIPVMSGRAERAPRVRDLIAHCRDSGVPVVFIQEVHKPNLIDIGRELDGAEGPHCLEGEESTELASWLEPRPEEFVVRKRRYSAFFGTELEIVLKAYKAETVMLVGGLTDICIHYTAADAHQHDYAVRVLTDCVAGSSERAHTAALEAILYLQRDSLVTAADVHTWLDEKDRERVGA